MAGFGEVQEQYTKDLERDLRQARKEIKDLERQLEEAMSETVIEPVYFSCKYLFCELRYCNIEKLWEVKVSDGDEACIVRFKQQSKAVAFCELLKQSE